MWCVENGRIQLLHEGRHHGEPRRAALTASDLSGQRAAQHEPRARGGSLHGRLEAELVDEPGGLGGRARGSDHRARPAGSRDLPGEGADPARGAGHEHDAALPDAGFPASAAANLADP
ncbi:hypothetical protein AWH51_13765 [Clavibacter tessellarius]|uniref:Uncharacterized protein n=1 Tax=Clavibacter tessellarius TaxID=31965 RepID=A0A154UZ57_9MICO|nr:hypothetical protein AWH51_13765 [Clavibacter michiganensis subsp. tessellarius]